jgi:hypothetical protein
MCPLCESPIFYVEAHDSYACLNCNRWLEPTCGCLRCEARPPQPTPVALVSRIGTPTA